MVRLASMERESSKVAMHAGRGSRGCHRDFAGCPLSRCTFVVETRNPHELDVNFLGDAGEARIRAAYPGETWDRLMAVKRRYDPTNVFRLNRNIPPG